MAVEPRKAAACILLRGDHPAEILLAKRNESLRFMPGQYVFPGGRIDDRESTEHVVGAESAEHARGIHAVAREVFEETGLLTGRGELPSPEAAQRAQAAMLAGEETFDDILREFGLAIHAEDFEPAGAWVTPKPSPIRFDTRYYLHRVRAEQEEHLIDGEIVALDWMTAREARRRWHRGEIKVSTPVAFALQQLAAKPYPDVLPFLVKGTERAPGEHSRYEIRRGITVIPLETRTIPPATHTNCVLVGEEEIYVFDPGADDPAEQQHLLKQLDNFRALGGTVRAIVLTHSHRDHIGAVEIVRETFDAPVWAHPATDEQVSFDVDRHLEEGDTIESPGDPDWRMTALHTPGHDPGHLCFYEESTRAIIAGDMVANPGTIVVSHAHGGSMTDFMANLERLSKIDARVLIPAHGRVKGKPREAFLEHLKHRQWREDKIRAAYEAGAQDFDTLLAAAYDDAPEAARELARHALEAHLAKLGIDLRGTSERITT